MFLVKLFTKSVARVPERRKTGDTRFAIPDLSRNRDSH